MFSNCRRQRWRPELRLQSRPGQAGLEERVREWQSEQTELVLPVESQVRELSALALV